MTIYTKETRDWLERLYSASPGFFNIAAFASGRLAADKWFATSDLDKAAKTIAATRDKADVYLSVATHIEPQSTRGGASTVISIPGYWADLDIGTFGHQPSELPNPETEEEALKIIQGLPEPSMLLNSGGGLQAFWLFDEPWVFEPGDPEPKQAARAWSQELEARATTLGYHVDHVKDLARILRAPGSVNHKQGTSRPVEVRWSDKPAVARASLDLGTTGPVAAPESLRASEDDGDLPLTWDEILKPHGYMRCSEDKWSRPDKDCSEGHSLSINPLKPTRITNYSESDTVLDHGEFKGSYSKQRLFQTLNPGQPLPVAKTIPPAWGQAIDWEELLTGELPEPEWLVEPLLVRGDQVALYSQPKAGKSLLMLEIAAGLAAGSPVLGNPAREPMSVVYVDQENGRRDIRKRVTDMGYKWDQLKGHLHYYSFPSLAMLDTAQGGADLLAVATYHNADIVVLDTLSRVVEGEENKNDTYHNLYRHTGVRLKAAGIAVIRLDHAGKEDDKGMRGASAKASDVDSVWWLAVVGEKQLVLTRTHQRGSDGVNRVPLTRMTNPLRHEVEDWLDQQLNDPVADIIQQLDLDEIKHDTGWQTIYKRYKQSHKWTQSQVQEAVKRRKGN